MIDPILEQVHQRIKSQRLSLQEAATSIGIGASALERHLSGEYVRSDSLAKYRLWLDGSLSSRERQQSAPISEKADAQSPLELPVQLGQSALLPFVPKRPLNVVDLFCGCGGMSLGFERFREGLVYRVAMALDIEAPMVRVFNDNHPSPSGNLPIARQSDITDFMNEAEIQGYYLDHLARTTGDTKLTKELSELPKGGIPGLRKRLRELDQNFLDELASRRSSTEYVSTIRKLGSAVLGQTSVLGFHNATKLPGSGTSYPKLGPLIWHHDGEVSSTARIFDAPLDDKLVRACGARARKLWDGEIEKLSTRATGAGRGQLASAADRINRFLEFIDTPAMRSIRSLWIDWRATREALRRSFFEDPLLQCSLRSIYEDGRQVAVLLGGPPCQGFSRIGRGKIRSLREQSVHVHEDEDSVDSRNQLMHQYVLFVAALAPQVFLFENVRHFQAVVKSEGIEFDAADILAEAIESVSTRGLGYAVSRRIVVASQHAVPQARERFVMAGVRKDLSNHLSGTDAASWCLSLQRREPVPLQVALEGLPEPEFSNQDTQQSALAKYEDFQTITAPDGNQASDVFRNWAFRGPSVDAHLARPPRPDDGAFFALMGPGKRWMDYRCDDAPTLQRLAAVLSSIRNALETTPDLGSRLGVSQEEVKSLSEITDGSLSLRLLLESIPPHPGELQHHLLTATYLRKREGSHGDWLSRMDPAQPSKTIVSHMAKDTYAFVHPFRPRTLSVREAARVQSFPDDYRFGSVGLVDGFRVVGNAVPPLLSLQFAERVAQVLALVYQQQNNVEAADHSKGSQPEQLTIY
ncbi:DNA cytosine methyltransferase [Pseudomonas aeruginosa]|uniref:DNA cytosine methyltransferase n=1 Tax=Pseudomonas TaxID=286 RepID=UPI000996907F|nr:MULTISPECIES: DNA cytosine methyltransferase [Pseudomonas]EKD1546899.1 DNA cytosine methyltransferase [Pseudomonas aeruginosa]EKV8099559.1 DNA cytosine methyltransferase [Pseudomonas aeruginosa]EKW6728678.1 DNA cytosine methyltransferase [Pseudomonas aeruginosa]MBG5546086.1 DNA cytosine methyltransferase [Pseudomonas aeruginosa]MBG5865513.1 DNA cytosine methyltransferase [Pseudomonas aeruginosa]